MRPHFLQTCSRSESLFGTFAPHRQRCDVPLASTFANRRPASSAFRDSNFRQLGCLVVVGDALAVPCVCFDALLKCRIIQAAGFRQLYTQALGFLVGYSLYLNVLRINDLSGSRCTSSPLLPKRGRLFQRSRNETTKWVTETLGEETHP